MKAVTRKRALRAFRPLWASTRSASVAAEGTIPDESVDVLIVGAGISGALMATALLNRGLSVLVVDRRKPVQGSSMASTAMIQHEIDVPLHKLIDDRGLQDSRRVWRRSAAAVETLTTLMETLSIDCGFERRKTLYLAGDAYGSRALRREADVRGDAGLDAQFLSASQLRDTFDISRTAAIDSNTSASANPAQMTAGLLRHAMLSGTAVVENIEITDVRSLKDANVAATSTGQLLVARHVVFCTGYEFLKALAHEDHDIISTWAIATAAHHPRPRWLKDYLVWEGSDPYLYFRSTPDGRLIVGGEDEASATAFRDPVKLEAKSRRLQEKLSDLLGISISRPDYAWAAAFGTTSDGLPLIGPVPGFTNVYAAMGYGGNGITFSQIAAEIISAAILGHRDADADLFAFERRVPARRNAT